MKGDGCDVAVKKERKAGSEAETSCVESTG